MDENQLLLLRDLQKENKWWSDGQAPPELVRKFKRADFFSYRNLIEGDYPNIVVGPRRIGKSTVLYQLIDFLITSKKIPPNRIIFLSLERPFFGMVKNPIKNSLQIFEEAILKEPLESLSKPIYIFLDEASRNLDWALQVKEYFDKKYKMKFFITGSSTPALFAKSSESLVGRHNLITMLPLKFSDVVRMANDPKTDELLNQLSKIVLRTYFLAAIKQNNPKPFADALQSIYVQVGSEGETLLQITLNKYLLRGGYPEFYDKNTSWAEASKIMREAYFDAIISYDMIRVFNSRNPDKIKALYTFLATTTAQQVNLSTLCGKLGISKTALNEYLSQLQETHLIKIMRPYKKNKLKIGNDIKKIYVGDIGLRNSVLGVTEDEINSTTLLGHLAETAAQDHTLRLKFNVDKEHKPETFFWKSDKKEVDIIIEISKKTIPIESKYSEQIKSEDSQELKAFIRDHGSPFGILLTKKSFHFDEKSKVISIPLWLYLLMC
ncbi:MAG TPA: ATP-binding protein [archaeon]|nr:ATP-binding protein [archaeon]